MHVITDLRKLTLVPGSVNGTELYVQMDPNARICNNVNGTELYKSSPMPGSVTMSMVLNYTNGPQCQDL
jgi:hypothetical protein